MSDGEGADMARLDLAIRGGQIVNAGGVATADLGITDGRIVQLGGAFVAAREIDATGKLLFPGGIDAHVHLTSPGPATDGPRWVDDFSSGSAAALAGGVTTLGNMTFLRAGELPLAGLAREGAIAGDQAIADWFLHPLLSETNPAVLDQIPALLNAGCNSIKFFEVMPGNDAQSRGYVEAVRRPAAPRCATTRRAGPSSARSWPPNGRSPWPKPPVRPSTSCTSPRSERWQSARRRRPVGCPCTSRPGPFTST